MKHLTIFTLLSMFPLIWSCATAPKKVMRNDPLIGKIVKGDTGEPINYKSLVSTLADHDVIYLSEKHDNPMHHAIQMRIIQELIDQGRSPAVGFEFFSFQDTPLLLNLVDARKKAHTPDMEKKVETRMREKLGWKGQPDKMWSYYWDLLTLAADNQLTPAGLDLSSTQKRRITRKGISGLTPIEKKQLFSTGLSNPAYESYMKSIFKAVHCGMDHGKMTERLYDTWVARNDRMALSIAQLYESLAKNQGENKDTKSGPVVIIMGNGHTESGLGVIDRVRHLNPEISQINLAMMEIFREEADLDDYLAPLELDGFDPVPPADFVWFTQRVSYEDPCKKFKQALDKMKKKAAGSETPKPKTP